MEENKVQDFLHSWDERTFKLLYKTYYKVLVGYAFQITDDIIASEDYVQDVFLKLYEAKPHFDNTYMLRAYLYNSVRHSSLDYLRHKQVESSYLMQMMQEHEAYEVDENGEEMFFKEEFYRQLAQVLNELPMRQREIIMLYLKGKKVGEIAALLNLSDETVKTHKKRALQAIKEKISESAFLLFILTFGS